MSARWSKGRKPGWLARQSLLTRYLLIVLGAFLFIPIIIPLASMLYMLAQLAMYPDTTGEMKYGGASEVESAWHAEAGKMEGLTPEEIDIRIRALADQYPDASLFWVDEEGRTRLELPEGAAGYEQWTADSAIRFMKASINGDPFTVVSFLGKENGSTAFMVLQLPRSELHAASGSASGTPFIVGFIFLMFAFLAAVSLLFFMHIRKRLLALQAAMSLRDDHGLPAPVEEKRQDEIGGLESAFNGMVEQLKVGRLRQTEEEELRKRLISNLSHDLRTPLTVMRGHLYTLKSEPLTDKGKEAVSVLEHKTEGLGGLIDNLLSYTLMTSGRYQLSLEPQDVLRLTRQSAASWYPVWENEGIEADISLPGAPLVWKVDREGFRRVLDNLFQNVVRHAAEGRYIGIRLGHRDGQSILVIEDRGPGLNAGNGHGAGKGAGIGLAIVEYLLREMGLAWQRESLEQGTRILIYESNTSDGAGV
ncbi:sensor histidine kinase [Paenibacillus pinisoli]|uniref:histidine kinase n=1 Tax=Paenibacillus pinisoli TaxID=1276110 RepID=A0A3A6PIK6_9BACL|nr:HAMP domain-containing sensor histidine kinase [Paenibacillus pinisoli]RJX40170.1 sensor histidine kinase [Paenibacillus pinisoli]